MDHPRAAQLQAAEAAKRLNDRICQICKARCAALNMVLSDNCGFSLPMRSSLPWNRCTTSKTSGCSHQTAAASECGTPFHVPKNASVMVWAGVTSDGKTPLIFVENGV